ncbi:metallophosphoesterase family protein [Bradyrhizobium sp. 83002]|uniref:metallophosphoesterase family protein n=1 Tax=Bradyrhizobium aeschynomenes TaxID=2734909 RepID=UPI00155554A7|nr:metallophosphoesterase family protein [Bradyrhizobium aeschynomenes]NPU13524.1 metallophosphoesterase family protein [Bradyrhizobium aeschynomenes]
MRIGIISDTHGLLRPEAKRHLGGVDHIIHAGDIGRPEIIDRLRLIAPVTAIRGNIDTAEWAKAYPATQTVELGGRRFHVVHDVHDLAIDPASSDIDMVISGHSHRANVEMRDGVMYLNPGSAGPRRFGLPITLATLDISPGSLSPVIHDLGGG